MRTIIFVNGQFHDAEHARRQIHAEDYILAVNGGTHHALSIDIVPHAIIGDLDSLAHSERARLKTEGTTMLQFPRRKDETDLELALRHAVRKEAAQIVLLAALGGRIDQCVGNLALLMLPELAGIDVQILDGAQTVFMIRDTAVIHGLRGDTVSILPMGGEAAGISNSGLEWPLKNATLTPGSTRGISNVMTGSSALVSVQRGMLLCVVTHASEEA